MTASQSRFVTTNGIRMHLLEQGSGPLVVFCHGFPECSYSWRHQLPALAAAGFRAVAPDQRGYGRTDCPDRIEAYDIFQLTGDIVGLVRELGEERAVVVGHDWGAAVAWTCALLRPDVVRAVALLSVPYLPRFGVRPTDVMRAMSGGGRFYQLYFQEPGKAEAELDPDPRRALRMLLYSLAGDPPPAERWRFVFGKHEGIMDSGTVPESLPPWLTEHDLDVYAAEFTRTGFRGGLNWYRNLDRNWELTPFLAGAKVRQPSLFAAGELDPVVAMYRATFDGLERGMPALRKKVLLPGAGHWVQQERPGEVNALLREFLAGV